MYNFEREKMTQMVSHKNWNGCWDYLIDIFKEYEQDKKCRGIRLSLYKDSSNNKREAIARGYTALISKELLTLLLNTDIPLSDEHFYGLARRHNEIHEFFTYSTLKNSDEQIAALLAGQKKADDTTQRKVTLLLSLNTNLDLIQIIKNLKPVYRAAALIMLLADCSTYTRIAHSNKIKLYALRKELEHFNSDSDLMAFLVMAYFHVTYIDYDKKHIVKENINRIVQKFLKNNRKHIDFYKKSVEKQRLSPAPPSRPRLIVYGETLQAGNAMNRSFSRRIKQLQDRFDVEFIQADEKADKDIKDTYKKIHSLRLDRLEDLFTTIHKINPDMMYMPSIGLNMGSLVLSNYRFAPIQVMGLGFCATPMSNYVDYIIGSKPLYHPDAFPKNKYIIDGAPILQTPTKDIQNLKLQSEFPDQPAKNNLDVCVVGGVKKFPFPFIELLTEIHHDADFEINFRFLCTDNDISIFNLQNHLKSLFPRVRIVGNQTYSSYFTHLEKSDIVLNTFPHGHSNTVIDTFLAGKPCIGLLGTEPHARTEYAIFDHLGLGNKFLAHSKDEYKTKFFEFAAQLLAGKRQFINPQDVYHKMYEEDRGYDYGEALYWVYKNHGNMKNSAEKAFEIDFSKIREH